MSLEKDIKVEVVSSAAINVIVCNKCITVVAEDMGRPVDVGIVANLTRSHLSTPPDGLGLDGEHEILTVDTKTNTSQPGLRLEKKFTD